MVWIWVTLIPCPKCILKHDLVYKQGDFIRSVAFGEVTRSRGLYIHFRNNSWEMVEPWKVGPDSGTTIIQWEKDDISLPAYPVMCLLFTMIGAVHRPTCSWLLLCASLWTQSHMVIGLKSLKLQAKVFLSVCFYVKYSVTTVKRWLSHHPVDFLTRL